MLNVLMFGSFVVGFLCLKDAIARTQCARIVEQPRIH